MDKRLTAANIASWHIRSENLASAALALLQRNSVTFAITVDLPMGAGRA